ncbi:major facilitator superfamily domain-containing protein [Bisporella sp. PMI_857]|nr:major facilitator superfamily domain-containing protein [Bisporella sp. PMI_857]
MSPQHRPPYGLHWRASTPFIIATVTIGLFTDLFLYAYLVPVTPFILRDRLHLPHSQIQRWTSIFLASYAGASLLFSLPAGIISDKLPSRRWPFLGGLAALFFATVLLWVGQSIAVLILARLLQGMSAAVVWTVGMALVMDTVGSENLGAINGTMFSIISVGELIAPLVGGLLYKKLGYTALFGLGFALVAIDLLMRLAIVEKKIAGVYEDLGNDAEDIQGVSNDEAAGEASPLLANKDDLQKWVIPTDQPGWVRSFPMVYCLKNPRLLVAMSFTLTQAIVLGTFDATLPTQAQDLYGFDSLQAGVLFAPLIFPNLICGPLAGRAVDRFGTKPAAVCGMLFLVVTLNLLRIPQADSAGHKEIIKFCIILGLNSIGLSIINVPGIVEASKVAEKYHKANKGLFGEQGPYGQLYAFSSMFYCAGLTIGPLIAGTLRDTIGYGSMNAVVAGLCLLIAVLSFVYIGDKLS